MGEQCYSYRVTFCKNTHTTSDYTCSRQLSQPEFQTKKVLFLVNLWLWINCHRSQFLSITPLLHSAKDIILCTLKQRGIILALSITWERILVASLTWVRKVQHWIISEFWVSSWISLVSTSAIKMEGPKAGSCHTPFHICHKGYSRTRLRKVTKSNPKSPEEHGMTRTMLLTHSVNRNARKFLGLPPSVQPSFCCDTVFPHSHSKQNLIELLTVREHLHCLNCKSAPSTESCYNNKRMFFVTKSLFSLN